jgi:Transglycosylase-like domain
VTMIAVPAAFAAGGPLSSHRGLAALSAPESAKPAPGRYRSEASRRTRLAALRARRHAERSEARPPRRVPAPAPAPAVPAALQAIAQCESGGNPRSIGGGGLYRGKYQFSRETWAAVGGSGDPAQAPEAEQDRRAIQLYAQSGAGQWPVCGA